jgi:hypothetical protein
MWRVIATVLTIGTIFAVVVVGCLSCSGAFNQPTSPDSRTSPAASPGDDSASVDDNAVSNGAISEKNGEEYATKARTESPELAVQDLENAAKNLESAAEAFKKERQIDFAQKCFDEAADDRYQWAILVEPSDRETARQILYVARDEAKPGSSISDEVHQELQKLT